MKKWLYITILILTVLDVYFTQFGIKKLYVKEHNPLLEKLFNQPLVVVMLIIVFAVAVCLYAVYRFGHKTKWLSKGIAIVMVVKGAILTMHIVYFFQYLYVINHLEKFL